MTRTIRTSDAPEVHDGRPAASQRIAMRLHLAEALNRVVLPLVTVYPDGELELLPADADDAACDLIQALDALGYAIGRTAP